MVFRFGDYELDEERFELRTHGVKVPAQPKVLEVLFYLVKNRDRVVLKRELLDEVWANIAVSEAAMSRVIMEARRAIHDELQQTVVTVRGRGFRFAARVEGMALRAAPVHQEAEDPSFVGRAACMAALTARLERAMLGRGGLAWLSGEPGIGKTRTADELARRARLRGARVFSARAHRAPEAPPFWLWAEVLRACAAEDGEAPGAPFAALLAGKAIATEQEFAVFAAVTRFFASQSKKQPIVLTFDDMQWADEPSLRLLQFFAREATQSSVLVLGMHRDTELADDARSRALGGVFREYDCLTIPLLGFGHDEVSRLVEITCGSSPSAALVTTLLERSGGNPLYLHQLVKMDWVERALTASAHEMASSMDLRQGLIESISQHLDGISAGARALLTDAAVLGAEFDLAKLTMVCGASGEALLDRLDEAARARVLVKTTKGGYRFGHALVREVLYKKLSSAERAARHRALGENLLAHYAGAIDLHAAELAHHFVRALPEGDAARAFDLAVRGAEQHALTGDHPAALRQWTNAERALAFFRSDCERPVRVALGRARSYGALGENGLARDRFLDAATIARAYGDAASLVEAALGFASVAERGGPHRARLIEEARAASGWAGASVPADLSARLDLVARDDLA
jgi:DNA-binding winged helix-turn-helix (wHTH) protein